MMLKNSFQSLFLIFLLSFSTLIHGQQNPSLSSLKFIKGFDVVSQKELEINFSSSPYKVFYFLNATCPCSKAHFDHLNQLKQKYPHYTFIGLHSNKSLPLKNVIQYYQQFKIDFPILDDADLKYANLFKAVKTPHVFIVSKEGSMIFQGGATNSTDPKNAQKFYLQDALNDISQGRMPKTPVAKTHGCYIQR